MTRTRKYQTNGERQAAYRSRCAQTESVDLSAPQLHSIPSAPGKRRWKALVKVASALLEGASKEMQDYFDQRSEQWQESEAGESITEMLESLENALESLEDISS